MAFWLAAFVLAVCQQTNAALSPTHLRCEYTVNPLGIDVPHPRLFWTLESKERGERQSAYQILVASSPDLLAKDNGDLWDTGKVVSDETTHIHYAGKELKSSQAVFWKVRSWGQDDKPSPWSAPGTWTMGILRQSGTGRPRGFVRMARRRHFFFAKNSMSVPVSCAPSRTCPASVSMK